MEKSFYDQPIDCDVKRYEEMIELTTRQGEGYTTGVWWIMITSKIITD